MKTVAFAFSHAVINQTNFWLGSKENIEIRQNQSIVGEMTKKERKFIEQFRC